MSLNSRCKISKDGKNVSVSCENVGASGLQYRVIDLKKSENPPFQNASYDTDIPIPARYQIVELKEGEELETFSQTQVYGKVVICITQKGKNQKVKFQNAEGINPSRLWIENKYGYQYYLGDSEKIYAGPWFLPREMQIAKTGISGLRICMDQYCQKYFRIDIVHN